MNLGMNLKARQTGATLIVGLVLLLVLTVVGVSGMNTATLQVAMAGSAQYQQDAFQMAEDGLDIAISRRGFTTAAPQNVNWLGDPNYDRRSVTTFVSSTLVPPDRAFSGGEGSSTMRAYHFDIVSVGKAARNSVATHHQSFYVIGPGG